MVRVTPGHYKVKVSNYLSPKGKTANISFRVFRNLGIPPERNSQLLKCLETAKT